MKKASFEMLELNTDDIKEWNRLARKHLAKYRLPKGDVPCTEKKMELWLDRLAISKHVYAEYTNTSLLSFITLNPDWPLRAWIGTVLEIKET